MIHELDLFDISEEPSVFRYTGGLFSRIGFDCMFRAQTEPDTYFTMYYHTEDPPDSHIEHYWLGTVIEMTRIDRLVTLRLLG